MQNSVSDKRWMALALSMGERGLGQTWPNPSVGCVIIKGNRVLGRGHTQIGGRPHAEVMALRQAGDGARGATAYVTLEPCAHTGQTPPCASALIDAGLSRVVVATTDPDTRVAGKGIQMLRDAGIKVTLDVMKPQADAAHAGFFSRVTQNKPFITLKNLATTARDTPVWFCHGKNADFSPWADTGATGIPCDVIDGRVNIVDAVSELANAGLTRIFCEGGGTLGGALIKAGLVDQLIIMQAGVVIGADGKPSLSTMGNSVLKNAPRYNLGDVRQIGSNTISIWNKS